MSFGNVACGAYRALVCPVDGASAPIELGIVDVVAGDAMRRVELRAAAK